MKRIHLDTAAGLMTDMGWWCFYGFFGPSPRQIGFRNMGESCVAVFARVCAATLPGRKSLPGTVEAALLWSVRLQDVVSTWVFKCAPFQRILS